MSKQHLTISDELRKAIVNSDVSQNSLCKELGIARSTLSRFVLDERGISMDLADRLAKRLGLELVSKNRRHKQ